MLMEKSDDVFGKDSLRPSWLACWLAVWVCFLARCDADPPLSRVRVADEIATMSGGVEDGTWSKDELVTAHGGDFGEMRTPSLPPLSLPPYWGSV